MYVYDIFLIIFLKALKSYLRSPRGLGWRSAWLMVAKAHLGSISRSGSISKTHAGRFPGLSIVLELVDVGVTCVAKVHLGSFSRSGSRSNIHVGRFTGSDLADVGVTCVVSKALVASGSISETQSGVRWESL